MKTELYPLTFAPIYKEKLWGGRLFAQLFNRDLPLGSIGESWDVAAHANGTSVVDRGSLQGYSLEQLVQKYGSELIGKSVNNLDGKFPLLLKFIDAAQDLSVQVHPTDEYIKKQGGNDLGKTEMWYIVHSEPGAWIIWGLRPGVTKAEFTQAVQSGGEAILACLNKVEVKPGEVYPISAGLVHALGAGVVVAEIQQNSDTTYRLYDWDRVDEQGRPRELHIEQALDVIDFSEQVLDSSYQLARCRKHFNFNVLTRPQNLTLDLTSGFQIITALETGAKIRVNTGITHIKPGQSCLLPACLGNAVLESPGVVLQTTLP